MTERMIEEVPKGLTWRATANGACLNVIRLIVVICGFCVANFVGAQILPLKESSSISKGAAVVEAATTNQPESISVWTHSPEHTDEFNALKAAAAAFNRKQRAYRVEIFPSIYRSYEDRVQNAAASGTLPWLVELDGPFLYPFAWAGYLQPIDKLVPEELLTDLLPSVKLQGTYNGRLYSLGQFESGLGLWGNRRYLREAGVRVPSVESPWGLAEFEEALARLSRLDGVEYALNLGVYDARGEFYSYAYAPILQGFGGDLIDRGTYRSAKGVLDGPRSVAAMTRFQQWFRQGWTRAVFDRTDDFEEGKAALSWMGHWKYPRYLKALGDNLVLMPLPDFGRGIKTGTGSWNWGISSACPNPAGAWEFLAHLMSREEILRMTSANGAVPARYSALAQSPLYGAGGPLRLFAQQLGAGLGVPRPATPGYGTIRKAFSDAVTSIIAGGEVQHELSRAADTIDEDIAKNGGYSLR